MSECLVLDLGTIRGRLGLASPHPAHPDPTDMVAGAPAPPLVPTIAPSWPLGTVLLASASERRDCRHGSLGATACKQRRKGCKGGRGGKEGSHCGCDATGNGNGTGIH
ncbi:hypothetical protein B0I35DRAFT_199868 [Stachybotrys elegans]|uniref:Uncharacterized protein n=1 Tax=Stachybotrys elegans TaxID=80388 RepID=A0A8K0SX97_9HYPO|nr:hypothetical protein B0I35DRAFT_199868 [Stachybotrys elegans]